MEVERVIQDEPFAKLEHEYIEYLRGRISLTGSDADEVVRDIKKYYKYLSLEAILSYEFHNFIGGEIRIPQWAFNQLIMRVMEEMCYAEQKMLRSELSLLGCRNLVRQEVIVLSKHYQAAEPNLEANSENAANQMTETMSVFEGITMVSKDWRVGVRTEIAMTKVFYYNHVTSRDFKGLRIVHKKSAVTIELDRPFDKTVLYVLVTLAEDGIDLKEDRIRHAFCHAFEESMKMLPEESQTVVAKGASLQCCTYNDVINFKGCRECNMGRIRISVEDQKQFGDIFLKTMDSDLEDLSYRCYFLYHEFNKNEKMRNGPIELSWGDGKNYNIKYAEETVLKFRREQWLPGKCLIWNNDNLNKLKLNGKRSYSNPMMITKYAGLMIDQTESPEYEEICKTNIMSYASIRFHLDPFREFRADFEELSAWGNPSVHDILKPTDPRASTYRLKELLQQIEIMERSCELVREKKYCSAIIDTVISMPAMNPGDNMDGVVWKRCYTYFQSLLDAQGWRLKSLHAYNIDLFWTQIDNTLSPALHTLKGIVNVAITSRDMFKNQRFTPLADDLRTAVVCEAVISFCLNGGLNMFEEGNQFSIRVIRQLNLKPGVFILDKIDNESPFQGLHFCGQFVSCSLGNDGKKKLAFCGSVDLLDREPSWSDLRKNATTETVDDIRYTLMKFNMDGQNGKFHYAMRPNVVNHLCTNIISLLNNYSASELFDNADGFAEDPTNLMNRIREILSMRPAIRINFWSSTDFVEDIFENSDVYEQPGLDHVIQELQIQMRSKRSSKVKRELARLFELEVLRSRSLAFLYPIRDDKWCVILPLSGDETEWFCRSSRDSYYGTEGAGVRQSLLVDWFCYAYHMTYLEKSPGKKVMSQTLTLFSVECMQSGEIPHIRDLMFSVRIKRAAENQKQK